MTAMSYPAPHNTEEAHRHASDAVAKLRDARNGLDLAKRSLLANQHAAPRGTVTLLYVADEELAALVKQLESHVAQLRHGAVCSTGEVK
ncbi:hypothetical protein NLX83_01755 [Allokutzneria sp. A3M-2-11 16]|uniref:hypothetical protein n=1 Tax=Allokutzneria sp. A3M-2-11 16 TaxID=2962043 RepID=UPI0020B6CBC5|nr:hypothetical protein [Allokutzneria sp. A3M-2-11 16]MCP3797974.1 hypothetical protein [Allokutzneria sp. A3M-2-11 16]